MLEINKLKDTLIKQMEKFIWDFKIADNIEYNLGVLYNLVYHENNTPPVFNYKKPISLIAVSIIEAIMVDFLYRLYSGTNHFPEVLKDKEKEIKSKLSQETKKSKYVDAEEREYWIERLKNFSLSAMIEVYKEFQLLGCIDQNYETLTRLSQFRNRIHIKNYFNNFEKDEAETFSEERVQKIINAMVWFFNYFERNYPRPWPNITAAL